MSVADTAARRQLVIERVRQADPGLVPGQILAALDAAVRSGRALAVVAQALEPGPQALASGAPPAVGALVAELRRSGSILAEPRCVICGQAHRKLVATGDGGVCPRCRNHQLATACAGCGVVKPVAGRGGQGQALCAVCAPRPKRTCSRCGRVRIIARRAHADQGELCDGCFKGPVAICGACGRNRECNFVSAGRPICASCSPRREAVCAHCGELRPPCARWAEGPVCEPCYRAALSRRGLCAGCGSERRLVDPPGPGATRCADCAGVAPLARCRNCAAEERLYRHGLCVRCSLAERVSELIPSDGPLGELAEAIAAAPQPYSAHNWLRDRPSGALLAEFASGRMTLSHEALDAHAHPRAANYLRHLLVAHGVLEARDEALVRLESWVAARLETAPVTHRRMLRSYATWRVLRRARQRSRAGRHHPTPVARAKVCLNAAIAFLVFLEQRGRELAEATQADIDAWLTEASAPEEVADFLDWAQANHHIGAFSVPRRQRRQGTAMDDEQRLGVLRRLLHDEGLELSDRVAGCLVLLYGLQLSRIVGLTRDQLSEADGIFRLHLGPTHIEVPEPLATMLRRLPGARRPKNGVVVVDSPWLFTGVNPGQPLNASHLGQRLRRLGIPTMAGRRQAMVHLAGQLPAAVLADLLGIAPTTAVHWVRSAGGDWGSYAAQLIRSGSRAP